MSGRRPGPRILLHGAATLAGREIRELLSSRPSFPVSELILCDPPGRDGLLTEFRGEAALSVPFQEDRLRGCDLAILCEATPQETVLAESSGVPRILLAPSGEAARSGPLVHAAWGLPPKGAGCVRVPCGCAVMLLTLLEPLRPLGIREAVGTFLLPASDRGQEGVEELLAQTQARLSFQEPPREIFSRTSAFDVFPVTPLGPLASREVEEVAGLPAGAVHLQALQVPVFHGTSLSIRVRLDRPGRAEFDSLLHTAGRLRLSTLPTAGAAAEADGILVAPVEERTAGEWAGLYAAADLLRFGAAANALEIAAHTLGVST